MIATDLEHHRDDTSISYGDRLIGRYQYAYNENSMMAYEARWYHDDSLLADQIPNETDFYFYDSIDRLEKAVYGATKYETSDIALGNIDGACAVYSDDTDHEGTFSDRIYYARRKTGTRSNHRREARFMPMHLLRKSGIGVRARARPVRWLRAMTPTRRLSRRPTTPPTMTRRPILTIRRLTARARATTTPSSAR